MEILKGVRVDYDASQRLKLRVHPRSDRKQGRIKKQKCSFCTHLKELSPNNFD